MWSDWEELISKTIGNRKVRFSQLIKDISAWQKSQGADSLPVVTAIAIKNAIKTGRLLIIDDDNQRDPLLARGAVSLKELSRERLLATAYSICDDPANEAELKKLAMRLGIEFDDEETSWQTLCRKVKDKIINLFTLHDA